MSKRYLDHDDGGVEYRETYDEGREVRKVRERASSFVKERGYAFVVFLGSMLSPGQNLKEYRAYSNQGDAQEAARELTRPGFGYPCASVKITKITGTRI